MLLTAAIMAVLGGCDREELTVSQAHTIRNEYTDRVFNEARYVPTSTARVDGTVGGRWVSTINNDPRSFNVLIAVEDPDSRVVVNVLFDYLVDYDALAREWVPNIADYEIANDEAADTTTVTFTLRDDLYWTVPGAGSADDGVQVTADDVVFWYNEIVGNPLLQQSGYASQFVTMVDGSEQRITVEKAGPLQVRFLYPRIVANPLLSSNMRFGPHYIYAPVLEAGGAEAVRELFTVDIDVQTVPSIGGYHIVEYTPGVRVVLARNPYYWRADGRGTRYPYIEELVMNIVPDRNAEFLLFKEGEKDSYAVRPEDLNELLEKQGEGEFTVYNGGLTLGSQLVGFNQNPGASIDAGKLRWFSDKRFRQAMSSLVNRPRVARQVYRGLAEPAQHLFAMPNPYFNPDISLEYTYDPERAVGLLGEMGIVQDSDGVMRDADGTAIEFDLLVGIENNVGIDIANIFADELAGIGVTLAVRPTDFQKIVSSLLSTYDWDAALFGLGVNYWPSGGANVWPSSGNLHFWHPLQETPATEWEAEVDRLYNEGKFTPDPRVAQDIYDEYQRILLEELPLFYIVHPYSFLSVRNEWENVSYDTLNGLESDYIFAQQ